MLTRDEILERLADYSGRLRSAAESFRKRAASESGPVRHAYLAFAAGTEDDAVVLDKIIAAATAPEPPADQPERSTE